MEVAGWGSVCSYSESNHVFHFSSLFFFFKWIFWECLSPQYLKNGKSSCFFLVAGAVLCFGSDVRTMLIAHWWFWLLLGDVYTKSRTFQFLGPCQQRAGGTREIGRGHSQDRWPELAKEVFHTIWHHAGYINWGKKKEGGDIWHGICLPE